MQPNFDTWVNLPQDMKSYNQWVITNKEKQPFVANLDTGAIWLAKPTEGPWMSYSEAVEAATQLGYGIGFILTADDPFACIDLDVKDCESVDRFGDPVQSSKWTEPTWLEMYSRIIETFDSFTEVSSSGKGAHIWVRANIGEGVRRDHVEVYSQQRLIVTTGFAVGRINFHRGMDFVVKHEYPDATIRPLQDRQELLTTMVEDMRRDRGTRVELIEYKEKVDDAELWRRASNADNAEKFIRLCNGDWASMGYPSQSEADLSLMSMFTYYSDSNEQCRRMFRQTALGKREKAIKNDKYLNFTLSVIRGRQERDARIEASVKINRDALAAKCVEMLSREKSDLTAKTDPLRINLKIPNFEQPVNQPTEQSQPAQPQNPVINYEPQNRDQLVADTVAKMQSQAVEEIRNNALSNYVPSQIEDNSLPWPPGVIGYIAEHIYYNAPRPVKEVAIVSALGLFAGYFGKPFNISGTGLNLYIILVARSAIGKEAMHSGISQILTQILSGLPGAEANVDFSDFVSAPSLIKAFSEKQCFVNVAGEWGRKLKRMADESGRDTPMQQLRTVMTNLYQKSGRGSIVGGLNYSNKEDNIKSSSGVAFSMIGETTPGTLYDSLTNSMMEDGFMSRFNLVEHNGDRPPRNRKKQKSLNSETVQYLQAVFSQCIRLTTNEQVVDVEMDSEVVELSDKFDLLCDNHINETDDERWRQMWNRAHLKVLRVSGLLAASDNIYEPVVHKHHFEWAKNLVMRDIEIMTKRLREGDVGISDNSRATKIIALFREAIQHGVKQSYIMQIPQLEKMAALGILPRRYLQIRVSGVTSFSSYRLGTGLALDNAIKDLIADGVLVELGHAERVGQYNFHGRCFQIVTPT